MKMRLSKILVYGIGLLIIYHFSRILTIIILVVVGLRYLFHLYKKSDKMHKIYEYVARKLRLLSLNRNLKKLLNPLSRAEISLVKLRSFYRIYRCSNDAIFVVINGFKITLFTIIKIHLDPNKISCADFIGSLYQLLSRQIDGFKIVINDFDRQEIYLILSTSKYAQAITQKLLVDMEDKIDKIRSSLAYLLSSPRMLENILSVDVLRNEDIFEVIIA